MLSRALLGSLALFFAFLFGALLLPAQVAVERSRAIAAPREVVHSYAADLEKMQNWSPWADRDPEMTIEWGEKRAGVGASMRWISAREDVGSGYRRIIQNVPPETVITELDLGDRGQATEIVSIESDGDGSIVTWGFETDLGANPLMRWLGLGFDAWIGADYERGLERLAELVEQ